MIIKRFKLVFILFWLAFIIGSICDAQPTELKVITYNIKSIEPSFDVAPHVKMILKEKPDLVAYQEVENRTGRLERRDLILEIAAKTGMFTLFAPAYTKDKGVENGEYGNAILSKFPISNSFFKKLPLLKDKGGSDPRVALIAEIILEKGLKVSVVNIHLDHRLPEKYKYEQIKPALDESISLSNPIILLGDFNAYFKGDFIQNLEQKFDKKCSNQGTFQNGSKLDYIFTFPQGKWSSEQTEVLYTYKMSDHYPLVSVLKFNN